MQALWQDIKNADLGWLVIWGLIYFGFLIGDLFAPDFIGITALKLLGLFICFTYAAHKTPGDHLLLIALGFTILSDIILALNNVNGWGVFTFCIAHFFHMSRLAGKIASDTRILPCYLAGVALVFLFGLLVGLPPLIVIGFIYAVTLASNLLLSYRWFHSSPGDKSARLAFYGFLAFLGCDLCVAISYCALVGWLPPALHAPVNYLVWAFYFPSQILICSSGKSVIQ